MDAGRKRCLPMWMLKRSAPEELQESENGENQFPFQVQPHIQASSQKLKATVIEGGEVFPRQAAKKLDENSCSLLWSETRKKSKKSSRRDVNCRTTGCSKSGLGRKKTSDRKAMHNPSAMRERSGYDKLQQRIDESRPKNDVDLETLLLTSSENDGGLTVEDLVSIAEEYVNADNEKQHWQKYNESKSEADNPSSSVFCCSECTTTTSNSHRSADNTESAPFSISRTDGVAQDMLDVLLGPLLRIPTEESKLERLRKKDTTTACEFSVLHREHREG